MRIFPALLALLLFSCSAKSGAPTRPLGNDDGGEAKGPCRALHARVTKLYQAAATAESIAQNLVDDFITANLHMVMADCNALPAQVVPCLQTAQDVESVEKFCVLPLDDDGLVEARLFANK